MIQKLFTVDGVLVDATPSVVFSEDTAVASIRGGDAGVLMIRRFYTRGDNKVKWEYKIIDSDFEVIGEGRDINTPPHAQAWEVMGTLISFLTACAEAQDEHSENWHLFGKRVRDYAKAYSDELTTVELELNDGE